MTSERTIEMALSNSNIKAAVETALLRAVGVVRNDEDVEFDLGLPDIVPIKLKLTKQELEVAKH